MTAHLRPLDLVIVAAYLIAITLFGLRFRERKGAAKSDRSLQSYFLANNTIPWWAIALSIVSAETSTLTIISIPGVAFAGDFGFLQVVLGYMLGRILVAVLFLPRYFEGSMLTAYQLIDQRFGPFLHKVTAGLFLLTRAAAEGVRVFAVSIVVGIAIGTRDVLSIAIISALTLLYTFEGGMAAVIWTDVVQMVIYLAGTLVAVWSLGHHIGADRSAIAGWATIHTVAGAAGKFHMLNFTLNLTTAYTFWAGLLGGTFLTMASHGTDQLMVQRMLAARNLRESRLALLSSGVVIFIQFALFLLIGVGLWVFYGTANTPGAPFMAQYHRDMSGIAHSLPAAISPDRIFPTFIVKELPVGIAGLLVAAILAAAMSNLSAALNSLSSTTVVDFYMHIRPAADARERNIIAKSSTVLWAFVLFAIAIYSLSVGGKGHVVEIGLSIASVAYGCLLGVFLLGTLTQFATEIGTAIGMLCGFALNLWLWQGTFPKVWVFSNVGTNRCQAPTDAACYVHTLTIPHIAFTWYVLIGAIVTFALGSLASLIFRKQSRRTHTVTAASLLLLFLLSFPQGTCFSAHAQNPATTPDFTPITTLLTDAIAAHKLPGAVVLIGHNNKVVFEHAYGDRKLANEPGLDGKPSPAEPMTEDTIFDMASLTKDLATATAIMQLYEQGKIASFDDPLEKYLPAFNPAHDPTRAKVTLRMLLTHTSGEAPDVDLRDPWGLAKPDKAEGIRRALTTPLKATPGSVFTYSDINFILLGDLVETLSGQPEDVYAREHIFLPLGMTDTAYHPFDRVCGPHTSIGAAIAWEPSIPHTKILVKCPADTWSIALLADTAPTTHDNEGNDQSNPHFDMLTRGTVHDPTTRRMGGVAGHAGVFSTAHDISLYASALLEKLLHNTGPFPLKQSTLQLMTQPEQPGHTSNQIAAANAAALKGTGFSPSVTPPMKQGASAPEGTPAPIPGLAPHYPAIPGQSLRGFGWDIDTGFSKPRGAIFPIGSFGHTGYTGTSLWMDPASDTYVILLANAVHPRDQHRPISNLRGQVATAAAKALGLDHTNSVILSEGAGPHPAPQSKDPESASPAPAAQAVSTNQNVRHRVAFVEQKRDDAKQILDNQVDCCGLSSDPDHTLTGIDVLESTHFAPLTEALALSCPGSKLVAAQKPCRLGLLTNQTGLDAAGHRTIDVLITNHQPLTTLFTPEHGLSATQDTEHLLAESDPTTHLPVISLFGSKEADRRPTHAQLNDLDAVVIDLQDAGVHFWTYEAAVGYFLEAASLEQLDYHHTLQIILLDRPNPVGGVAVQGPVSDPGAESYVNYMPLPVRHGLTLGELARYIVVTNHLSTRLTVVAMQHWSRTQFYAQTGLPWVNPSPNLRSPEAALRYPALGLIEYTNLSVGRGTNHPFSFFGAGWFDATTVAAALTARHIPGVSFTPTTETIAEDANHYPFHGQTIPAVRLSLTDPTVADTPEIGVEILAVLHRLYPTQFQLAKDKNLLCNQATLDALTRGGDPRSIALTWKPALDRFRAATAPYLLYK
jgi:SSS family transporter